MKKKTIIYSIIIVIILILIPVGSYYSFNCIVSKEDKIYIDKLNFYVDNAVGENNTLSEVVYEINRYDKSILNHNFSKRSQRLTYNQKVKKFGILNPFGVVSYPKEAKSSEKNNLWIFVDKEKEMSNKYSNYLMDDFVESGDNQLRIVTGLDVGNNYNPYDINVYHNKECEEIKIVTRNGNLHFYSGKSYFTHYGSLNNVIFENDLVYRYGEFGKVDFMDIQSSNIYLNRFSAVYKIFVNKAYNSPYLYIDSINSVFYLGKDEEAEVESNIKLPFINIDKDKFKDKKYN